MHQFRFSQPNITSISFSLIVSFISSSLNIKKEQSNYLDHSLLITSMIIISVPTSPPQPEKYRTSDNNSHPLPKESDDPVPVCGIPPGADAYEHS